MLKISSTYPIPTYNNQNKRTASDAQLDQTERDLALIAKVKGLTQEKINKIRTLANNFYYSNKNHNEDYFVAIQENGAPPECIARKIGNNIEIGIIGKEIGNGAWATINEIHMLESDQVFALKIGSGEDENETELLQDYEARKVIANENHRGIPKAPYGDVYDEDGQFIGFLLELYDCNYQEKFQKRATNLTNPAHWDWIQIGKEWKDIAHAIRHVHLTHMHGDICALNFLCKQSKIDGAGEVHITDFGKSLALASLWNETIWDEEDHLHYWATPEADECRLREEIPQELQELNELKKSGQNVETQIKDLKTESVMLGKAIDIFSVGKMMYSLLCDGKQPFPIEDEEGYPIVFKETETGVIPIQPQPMNIIGLPDGLENLIIAMLDPFPEKRPSAQQLIDQLEAIFPSDASNLAPHSQHC